MRKGERKRSWDGQKLGMAGSEREDPRRERASSLKGARKGVKVA